MDQNMDQLNPISTDRTDRFLDKRAGKKSHPTAGHSPKKKTASSRIRFIPIAGDSLFAINRPFKAELKNTQDPHIKKLRIIPDETLPNPEGETVRTIVSPDTFNNLKKDARKKQTSISAVIENIVESFYEALRAPTPSPADYYEQRPGAPETSAFTDRYSAQPATPPYVPGQERPTRPSQLFDERGNPLDYILLHIIEAADLILDEATPRLKEEVFGVIHHALKILVEIKKESGGAITAQAKQKLLTILDDLGRLRSIADAEVRGEV